MIRLFETTNPWATDPVLVLLVPAAEESEIPEPVVVVIVLSLITMPEFVPETLIVLDKVLFEMLTLVGGVVDAPETLMPWPTVVNVAVLPDAVKVFG